MPRKRVEAERTKLKSNHVERRKKPEHWVSVQASSAPSVDSVKPVAQAKKPTRAEKARQRLLDDIYEKIVAANALTETPRSVDALARLAGLIGRPENWRIDIPEFCSSLNGCKPPFRESRGARSLDVGIKRTAIPGECTVGLCNYALL